METNFQSALGKNAGEVLSDIESFLSTPYPIHPTKKLDLCKMTPNLNMREQMVFALLAEANIQGWEESAAENFVRRACGSVMDKEDMDDIFEAFRNPSGDDFDYYKALYGNRFVLFDDSYFSGCFSVGVDSGDVEKVMEYLRRFLTLLTEFAYMEGKEPKRTYAWGYYESFQKMMEDFAKEEPALADVSENPGIPVKVAVISGSIGRINEESYQLSLGLNLENPNEKLRAKNVKLKIQLKDKDGNVIATVTDKLLSIDAGTTYHYGITKKITGAPVASFSASASAEGFEEAAPLPANFLMLTDMQLTPGEKDMTVTGILVGQNKQPIPSLILHFQFLNKDGKILGGAGQCLFDGLSANSAKKLSLRIPMHLSGACKVVHSADFDESLILQ